ncbi:MAG: hypothetical protein ACLUKN_12305 [Bacilli bacterium]
MNLVKNILAVASVCLTLLSCAFAESVSESENSFSVSGKNYRIEFDKSCGAIIKIFSNDRELSLKNSSDALWSAKFTDHTKIDSPNAMRCQDYGTACLRLYFSRH